MSAHNLTIAVGGDVIVGWCPQCGCFKFIAEVEGVDLTIDLVWHSSITTFHAVISDVELKYLSVATLQWAFLCGPLSESDKVDVELAFRRLPPNLDQYLSIVAGERRRVHPPTGWVTWLLGWFTGRD